ncbi:hypothetical protein N2152v2_000752 [Parachlorella kessleri]
MLSVLGAAGSGVDLQGAGLQRTPVGSQPPRRNAAGVTPGRRNPPTGGRQRLPTTAEAGGNGSNRGGGSGDASSPIPWTQELGGTLMAAVGMLGGPYVATPRAVLDAVKWPGLTEAQVAGFLQMLRVQMIEEQTGGGAAGAVESQNGNAGGRPETPNHPGNGEPSRLHWLVAEGRMEEVQRLVQQGYDPNSVDSDGMTPLHLAAKAGKMDCIRLLVQHGADLEARGPYNCTPLHLAAYYGHGAACKELLALGASFGSRDGRGHTPLVVAAVGFDHCGEGIRALVQLGASPDERDPMMQTTPLHAAALCGAVGQDRTLLELGAAVDAANTRGLCPLHLAAISTAPEALAVAQLLVQAGADVSARDSFGRAPLHYAAVRGKSPFIRFLLSSGADHEAKDNNGFTPAQLADLSGHADARSALVAARTQVGRVYGLEGVQSLPARSVLWHVSLEGPCRELFALGAKVNTRDNSRITPLMLAAGTDESGDCVRVLVQAGADVECTDALGMGALHYAVMAGLLGPAKVLLEAGAAMSGTMRAGMTAVHLAAASKSPNAGAMVRLLLAAGAAPSAAADKGLTPLHVAAVEGNVEVVRVLLQAGARADARDCEGRTPAQLAAQEGVVNAEVAKLLRQAV